MEYDIIIVGAGPAGLATGLNLAQSAPDLAQRTLILEREHHPRPKLCAGGVLPGAEVCLRKLGLDMLSAVPSVPVQEMHLRFEGRSVVLRREPACFRVVRREQFDGWLADTARERGLAIQEGTRVLEVCPPNGPRHRAGGDVLDGLVTVRTDRGTYHARAVVGADGALSTVRRAVVSTQAPQVARVLEVRLPAATGARTGRAKRAIFDFSWIPDGVQGYYWDFPSQDGGQAERTWGVYDSRTYRRVRATSLKPVLQGALARAGRSLDQHKLEGHPLRWFRRRGTFAAPHILLAGDAAGTDSLVGEGISFALGYGEVAAEALRAAFADGDFSFSGYRQRIMAHQIGRSMSRRAMGAALLYGLRNRRLLWLLWPLIGWAANRFFVGWDWGAE